MLTIYNTLKTKKNKKGFTLAELLIVVAIIGVLLAILIPTFTGALHKAELTADAANARSNYSEAIVKYMDDGTIIAKSTIVTGDIKHSTVTYSSGKITVTHNKDSSLTKEFPVDAKAISNTGW